jgi:glycosyltransferase involved in cell wall biosynthesis
MNISVVIPAHNEENYIGQCLSAVRKAGELAKSNVEIIVVANRCTDRTEEIARSFHARIVKNDSRNLSAIRNAGLRAAGGEALVSIDADSVMSENALFEARRALESGRYVGGGARIRFERYSPGLLVTHVVKELIVFTTGLSGGMFWFCKRDFEAIGGFDESMYVLEDADFAKRLKQHGRRCGRRYIALPNSSIITSTRKWDKFGDWTFFKILFREQKELRRSIKEEESEFSSKYFYDFNN